MASIDEDKILANGKARCGEVNIEFTAYETSTLELLGTRPIKVSGAGRGSSRPAEVAITKSGKDSKDKPGQAIGLAMKITTDGDLGTGSDNAAFYSNAAKIYRNPKRQSDSALKVVPDADDNSVTITAPYFRSAKFDIKGIAESLKGFVRALRQISQEGIFPNDDRAFEQAFAMIANNLDEINEGQVQEALDIMRSELVVLGGVERPTVLPAPRGGGEPPKGESRPTTILPPRRGEGAGVSMIPAGLQGGTRKSPDRGAGADISTPAPSVLASGEPAQSTPPLEVKVAKPATPFKRWDLPRSFSAGVKNPVARKPEGGSEQKSQEVAESGEVDTKVPAPSRSAGNKTLPSAPSPLALQASSELKPPSPLKIGVAEPVPAPQEVGGAQVPEVETPFKLKNPPAEDEPKPMQSAQDVATIVSPFTPRHDDQEMVRSFEAAYERADVGNEYLSKMLDGKNGLSMLDKIENRRKAAENERCSNQKS